MKPRRKAAPDAWEDIVEFLQVRTRGALSQDEAHELLEQLGERIASLVLLRAKRVVWPGLGIFYIRPLNGHVAVVTETPQGVPVNQRYQVPPRLLVGFRAGKHSRRPLPPKEPKP